MRVKTRFAPSPSGDLHLGNVRTALMSYLLAKHHRGQFLLRIEDTDAARSSESSYQAILADLRWLGLHWDEGAECGGAQAPYRQSERGAVYGQYLAQLAEQNLTYPCFCSPEVLNVQRKTQLAAGKPPRYAGTCAKLTAAQAAAKRADGTAASLRFRVSAGVTITFDDLVRGAQKFLSDDIGDFVITRADGSAAFFFSNAVDDAVMSVTHVIRGDDHISNTPRQLLLLRALNLPQPQYGHVSLIVGADGAPLSKRHGSTSLKDLREKGYLPLAASNMLARLGHHYTSERFMPLTELAAELNIASFSAAPAHFDEAQLTHWQREAVLRADDDQLWAWLDDATRALIPTVQRAQFIDAVRPNVLSPADASDWAKRTFAEPLPASEGYGASADFSSSDFFGHALAALTETMDFNSFVNTVKAASGCKGKALFQPLRVALTGLTHGPEMQKLFPLIGFARARARLQHAKIMSPASG